MALRPASCVLLAGLSVLVAGCGAPDISESISDYVEAVDGSLERLCDCAALQGHDTIGECKDALGQGAGKDEEEACIADALAGDEQEGEEYLSCATVALRDYADCLADNENCDMSFLELCVQDMETKLDACGMSQLRGRVESCSKPS
ncbi:hypothetical protein PPSIR1_38199 [Plesiocystis pacifica SIR-1]|uniref:Lipoprotein n=1 Tax=Plesiocystis pacifica SIR-1 TaxID=391625 RepID=A6GBR9_9BACT|nr:hypothetical protein [Plesiocystis pacifica]EDM76686.1 hypothetical protein PPSIR1_38199 [Plesiocystis pacifica SIR-1]